MSSSSSPLNNLKSLWLINSATHWRIIKAYKGIRTPRSAIRMNAAWLVPSCLFDQDRIWVKIHFWLATPAVFSLRSVLFIGTDVDACWKLPGVRSSHLASKICMPFRSMQMLSNCFSACVSNRAAWNKALRHCTCLVAMVVKFVPKISKINSSPRGDYKCAWKVDLSISESSSCALQKAHFCPQ